MWFIWWQNGIAGIPVGRVQDFDVIYMQLVAVSFEMENDWERENLMRKLSGIICR